MNKYILQNNNGKYYHGIDCDDKVKFVDIKSRACKYHGRECADKKAKELNLKIMEYEN